MKEQDRVEIRRADTKDARLLSALAATTFYEAYYEDDDPFDLANYIAESFHPNRIGAELTEPNAAFFIVFLAGKAVGYAKLRAGEKPDCVGEKNALELQRIYLLERVLKNGIGEILLRHCLSVGRQKGFRAIWLSVWEKNSRALGFYRKHDFHQVGTILFPYGKTAGTNFVMAREL